MLGYVFLLLPPGFAARPPHFMMIRYFSRDDIGRIMHVIISTRRFTYIHEYHDDAIDMRGRASARRFADAHFMHELCCLL